MNGNGHIGPENGYLHLPDIVPEPLSSSLPASLGFPPLFSTADSSLPNSSSDEDDELSASDAVVVQAEDDEDLASLSSASRPSEDEPPPPPTPVAAAPLPSTSQTSEAEFEEASSWVVLGTMLSYALLFLFGYLRDALRYLGLEKVVGAKDLDKHRDFVPLLSDFENFYIVNVVRRTFDCWKRPICSVPSATTTVMERVTADGGFSYQLTGKTSTVLNLSSYNYLGFAQNSGPCAEAAKAAIRSDGLGAASPSQELGHMAIQHELEQVVADFVGSEDAVCCPMGFATNSLNIPAIAGRGCLLLSDELNHCSLITGMKLSGATKRIFKHNDMEDLERKLRDAIILGQPRTRRPFRKIIVIVEGVYSMEGTIVKLPQVIALKKKYKAYLYLDEAHSTGAMGPNGRGIVDYWGADPRDVDFMMGTFTKSFGSVGGYIAGDRRLIAHLRTASYATAYGSVMSPPAAQQVISAMGVIRNSADGLARIRRLRRNSRYFRRSLQARGFITYGHEDSPVIPLLLYSFPAVSAFSREMLARFAMATVTVAFPATPIYLGRARFCVSSAHSKEMIDQAVDAIDILGDEMGLKFSPKPRPAAPLPVQY